MLKGRSNYACLHRIREGVPDDQGVLVEVPDRLAWAPRCSSCAPGPSRRPRTAGAASATTPRGTPTATWRQVSVNHRECLGATKCPFAQECFAERAKEKALRSHLIVTNHSLLAIDAIEGVPMIPDYDAVVIDEAHELVARVTQAATDELAVADVERAAAPLAAARRASRPTGWPRPPTRWRTPSRPPRRAASTRCPSSWPRRSPWCATPPAPASRRTRRSPTRSEPDAGLTQAKGLVQEVFVTAERMAADHESDVLWLSEAGERIPARLHVAPLQVWGPMRDKLLTDKTAVMTCGDPDARRRLHARSPPRSG